MIFLERVMFTRNIAIVLPPSLSARLSLRSLCASGAESIPPCFAQSPLGTAAVESAKSYSSIWPATIAPRRISDIRTGSREASFSRTRCSSAQRRVYARERAFVGATQIRDRSTLGVR
jgi:hypothetical protein